MKELILVLDNQDINYLGGFRTYENIYAAQDDNLIWLKISDQSEELMAKIKTLPVKEKYLLDKNDNLFFIDQLTPVAKLKNLNWLPINYFVSLEFPQSLSPAKVESNYLVKLIASARSENGQALITSLDLWKKYVETASEIRLNKLIFAVSENGQVLVIGEPLPSIPGKEYWLKDNILIPCGYNFEIPIIASLISEKLDSTKTNFIVFDINSDYEKISKENFVSVTRSAVRLTK